MVFVDLNIHVSIIAVRKKNGKIEYGEGGGGSLEANTTFIYFKDLGLEPPNTYSSSIVCLMMVTKNVGNWRFTYRG